MTQKTVLLGFCIAYCMCFRLHVTTKVFDYLDHCSGETEIVMT